MTICRGADVGAATKACQDAAVGGATGALVGYATPPNDPLTCCIAGIALGLITSTAKECYDHSQALRNPTPQGMA